MARQVEARLTLASGSNDDAALVAAALERLCEMYENGLTGWEVRVVDDVDVET